MTIDLAHEIKLKNGYSTKRLSCKECVYFQEDESTDNFGPGDLCVRNPDVVFRVEVHGVCNKFNAKAK